MLLLLLIVRSYFHLENFDHVKIKFLVRSSDGLDGIAADRGELLGHPGGQFGGEGGVSDGLQLLSRHVRTTDAHLL